MKMSLIFAYLLSITICLLLCQIHIAIIDTSIKTIHNSQVHSFKSKVGVLDVHFESLKKTNNPSVDINHREILCLHGFGGNSRQFRKNLPVLAESGYNVYAMDLLGYGYSSKPSPKQFPVNDLYNFDTWTDQAEDFIDKVIQKPTFLVCNSVGGIVGLSLLKKRPDLVKGLVLINISLRMLHMKKQSPILRPFVSTIQSGLRETFLGPFFFKQVAQQQVLKNILSEAYGEVVDDETVDVILKPGLEPGACEVFLDFISYSSGPLPEELLEDVSSSVSSPVRIFWGENDPWEPLALGKKLKDFKCVDEFVILPNGGHCPMDQIPATVNNELLRFLRKYH